MRLIATDVQRGRCVCVCLLSPTKADEPIVMPFGLWPRVGPMKHVLGVSRPDPAEKGQIWQHLQAHYEVQEYPA